MPSTAPATPPRPRCAPTAPRWRSARRRRRWRRAASRSAPRAGRLGCSRACAVVTAAATPLTVPFGAPALLSGRLTRADGAGISRTGAARGRAALARRPGADDGRRGHHRRARRLRASPRAGPVAAAHASASPATLGWRRPPGPRSSSGCAPASPFTRPHCRCGPARRCGSAAGSAAAARRSRGAASWSRSSTWRRRPHRWRPVLVTRTDHGGRFRAHYRFRYVDGAASIRLRATALAEERWPYAPGSSRPVTVRVSGR